MFLKQKEILFLLILLANMCFSQNIPRVFYCSSNIANQTPLTNLIVSETFKAGDFPVKVLELTGSNPYSGKGFVTVPYLADTRIAVEFNNITINTNYQLINGVVETTYNPSWNNVSDAEDLTGEGEGGQVEQTVPFVIGGAANITVNPAGDIVITGPNNQQVTIPGGKDVVITDSQGNVYNVDSAGNVSGPFAQAAGGAPTPANTDGVNANGQATAFSATGVKVIFKDFAGAKYAFDDISTAANAPDYIKSEYKKVGNDYLIYKAVVNQQTDYLIAKVEVAPNATINLNEIVFKTQRGALVPSERVSTTNEFKLKVSGTQTYADEEVLATIKQGEKYKVAGAFKLVHISAKDLNVVLVPMNNKNIPNTEIAKIKDIYKKAGVNVNVTISTNKIIETGGDDHKVEVGNSNILSIYTNEQKEINKKIKLLSGYNLTTYYLLYSDLPPSVAGIGGFMALTGQFGYVFSSTDNFVVAHELGHGALGLEHPFKTDADQGKTNFLMDYSIKNEIWHKDWKQINDPKFRFYNFQGDSEGNQIDVQFNYLMPNGLAFRFKPDAKNNINNVILVDTNANGGFPNGTLYSFKINDKTYEFKDGGFVEKGTTLPYENKYTNSFINVTFKLIIYSSTNNCEYSLVYRKLTSLLQPDLTIPAKAIKYLLCGTNEISLINDYTDAEQNEIYTTWFFIKDCIEAYKLQTEGFVPRCLWDHNNYVPTGIFVPYYTDPALISGVVDGILEMGKGLLDLVTFINCYNPTSINAWIGKPCFDLRTKTSKVIGQLVDLATDNTKLNKAFEEVGASFSQYLTETVDITNQARYNQGKLVFNIASLFIGVGEANAIIKGETTLLKVVQASIKSYASIPKTIAKLMQRASNSGLAYVALKAGNKGAYLAYKLANTEVKLAEFTVNKVFTAAKTITITDGAVVLETLDNIPYLDELGNIKNSTFTVVKKDGDVFVKVQNATNWMDEVFDIQKLAVNQNKNIISTASNNAKGAWGEMASDVFLTEKGFQPLHPRKSALTEGWGETGIDGIFKKDGIYYIVEAKYKGTATLSTLADGIKQMSDPWISQNNYSRLLNAVGDDLTREIRNKGYIRLLAESAPDGTVIYKELDESANVIQIFNP